MRKIIDGWTALMGAAANGHTKIVQLILEKGADVNAKDKDGWTALMGGAAENGHIPKLSNSFLKKGQM
jgi:ankyrin repeat protein